MRHLRIALALCALLATLAAPWRPAAARPVVLYDAAAGGTPDGQAMIYLATDGLFRAPPVAATQAYVGGLTELKTDAALGDMAGYAAAAPLPALDLSAGFTLTFRLQLLAEQHTRPDRAGLSVLALGADGRGVELGLWADRVWAQADSPLFTRAEEALVDTSLMTTYELALRGDTYTLRGGGATLSGPLRDYSAAAAPVYRTPNFVFLGDNTTSAGSLSRLAYVAVEPADPPPASPAGSRLALPLLSRP